LANLFIYYVHKGEGRLKITPKGFGIHASSKVLLYLAQTWKLASCLRGQRDQIKNKKVRKLMLKYYLSSISRKNIKKLFIADETHKALPSSSQSHKENKYVSFYFYIFFVA
jgi:hypothetical protein